MVSRIVEDVDPNHKSSPDVESSAPLLVNRRGIQVFVQPSLHSGLLFGGLAGTVADR